MLIKKKGQIVPKYLVKAVEKKSQHLVKFGCDVLIDGKSISSVNGGIAIIIPEAKYCNLKKNKKLVKGFDMDSITFSGFDTCIHVTGQTNVSVSNVVLC